ncbi:hypothetical protein Tco_1144733 [Tanacetum coccineum]
MLPLACEYFLQDNVYDDLVIEYHGNSIPEWFTYRSAENHVNVELPLDWSYDKFSGYATCVVFKRKKPVNTFKEGYSVKNFDGASLITENYFPPFIQNFDGASLIWLHYRRVKTRAWKEAKNFVTFSFFENNKEDVEVKECGVRLICDEDIQQEAHLSMLQGLPTLSQRGNKRFGAFRSDKR